MIYDSIPYRSRLKAFALSIEKREQQCRWPESALTKLEIDCITSFYIMRKLLDARKLPPEISTKKYSVTRYAWSNPAAHKRDAACLHDYYNFERPTPQLYTLRSITNWFVHSYYFAFCFKDRPLNSLEGLLINTDHSYQQHLFLVPTALMIEASLDCQYGIEHGIGTWKTGKDGVMHWAFTPVR